MNTVYVYVSLADRQSLSRAVHATQFEPAEVIKASNVLVFSIEPPNGTDVERAVQPILDALAIARVNYVSANWLYKNV